MLKPPGFGGCARSVKAHHGNMLIRAGTDIKLPVLDSDTAFAVEFDCKRPLISYDSAILFRYFDSW